MNGMTIYHVSFGDDDNHYFGSLAAVFDRFTAQELGVSLARLYDCNITPEKPFRKGTLHRKKTNRKNPNANG